MKPDSEKWMTWVRGFFWGNLNNRSFFLKKVISFFQSIPLILRCVAVQCSIDTRERCYVLPNISETASEGQKVYILDNYIYLPARHTLNETDILLLTTLTY